MLENGTYKLNILVKNAKNVCYLAASLDDWHQRLGHISKETILYMAKNKIVDGLVIANNKSSQCEACSESKITRCSHPMRNTIKADKPGLVLHFDTVGPISKESLGGSNYFVLCKDEFSSYRKVAFVCNKSEVRKNRYCTNSRPHPMRNFVEECESFSTVLVKVACLSDVIVNHITAR